jgi:hypothetical protein
MASEAPSQALAVTHQQKAPTLARAGTGLEVGGSSISTAPLLLRAGRASETKSEKS